MIVCTPAYPPNVKRGPVCNSSFTCHSVFTLTRRSDFLIRRIRICVQTAILSCLTIVGYQFSFSSGGSGKPTTNTKYRGRLQQPVP